MVGASGEVPRHGGFRETTEIAPHLYINLVQLHQACVWAGMTLASESLADGRLSHFNRQHVKRRSVEVHAGGGVGLIRVTWTQTHQFTGALYCTYYYRGSNKSYT